MKTAVFIDPRTREDAEVFKVVAIEQRRRVLGGLSGRDMGFGGDWE
jgi:hypothetical protein